MKRLTKLLKCDPKLLKWHRKPLKCDPNVQKWDSKALKWRAKWLGEALPHVHFPFPPALPARQRVGASLHERMARW